MALTIENSSRYTRDSQSRSSLKQRRSGYEPSDTESEWQESPWHDLKNNHHEEIGYLVVTRPKTPPIVARNISPLGRNEGQSFNHDISSMGKNSRISPNPRKSSKSPYKLQVDGDNDASLISTANQQRNTSPFAVSERRRHISPYNTRREVQDAEFEGSNRKRNHRPSHKFLDSEENGVSSQLQQTSRVGERSNLSRRTMSAPKLRAREREQQITSGPTERRGDRNPSPLARSLIEKQKESSNANPPSSEINEMVANANLSNGPFSDARMMQSIDSISPGDIFFSRDYTDFHKKLGTKEADFQTSYALKSKVVSERNTMAQQRNRGSGGFDPNAQVVSVSNVLSRTNKSSASSVSRLSSGRPSHETSKMSGSSGKSSENFRRFTANRQRNQTDTWFGCVRKGPCRTSKSPEPREFDEASFIEKAFVVENLRQLWADKHGPRSLSGFICHRQQAQHLKQLISHNNCPHILFRGPSGSGKKALIMALLQEIYGASAWKISHDLRYFQVQEGRPMEAVVPLTSSLHHVELNLRTESKNARYALMALVKEIASNHATTPESDASLGADYKVIVLHEADKLAENVQHLVKWIMDCYSDACKIILSCEDDTELLEPVKSRCKLITVDAPVTHEIMEVLIHIARKENFDLPMSFAAKIATKSKQNLRKAIMALEACKAHNYPFVDEQPIPLGWEEVLVELANEILADPSPKRLFFARGKFQKLLVDFVHPKLILQKLVEHFLKGVEASLKRELFYWHAYYDKRLPTGTSALLKLEEFVAKFMSIYRKSFGGNRAVFIQ